jgi:hypothetical protein
MNIETKYDREIRKNSVKILSVNSVGKITNYKRKRIRKLR